MVLLQGQSLSFFTFILRLDGLVPFLPEASIQAFFRIVPASLEEPAVHISAFIVVPGNGSSTSLSTNSGSVLLGGVAYAGSRGISKVEVSFDGKSLVEAELKKSISNLTCTLWTYD
jgi:hypothetical protein